MLKIIFLLITVISPILNHQKGDFMRKLANNAPQNVIHFNANSFKDYVLKHPRPYDVVLLFTLRQNCNFCEMITDEFSKVAQSYHDLKAYKPDIGHKKRAVIFGLLHYSEETNEIIKSLKLPAQTTILYTTPHNIVLNEKNEPRIVYDEEVIIAYKDKRDFATAHKIIEFVNARSSRKIELKKNPILFLFYFIIFVGILTGGFYLYTTYKSFFLSPILWITGTLILYIICIGGVVYNAIHRTPFAKTDRSGNIVEWIHTGQRSQYAGEGYFMSTMFVIVGSLMFSVIFINKIRGYWNHKIMFILLTILIALCLRTITGVYRVKASWYGPEFTPPYNYIKGPLLKDQGNAF